MSGDDWEMYRAIGALQATNEGLERRLEKLEEKMDALVDLATTAKGGWKMLLAVGTAAASIGAGFATIINWVRH